MNLSEWQMPMAVLGLLLALLLSAGLVNRYQQYRATQRALLRALLIRVQGLEQALAVLGQIPLGRALRSALRSHVVQLYRQIRAIHRGYPGIDSLLESASAKVQADGGAIEGSVPAIDDEAQYRLLISAIDRLLDDIGRIPVPVQQQQQWRRELLERRAEILARYHIVQAHRQHRNGRRQDAIARLQYLSGELRRRGPDTAFVRALHEEAEALCQRLLQGKAPEPGTEDDAGPVSSCSSAA